ncbi:lysophospholipase [Lacihabitans sp. CCS-44]|uniref:SGNH/GDSL hydrolase family protein n=1 Tax=Lacihabitans sp. CCS-44 TaxID=2487331 RepID=UPI0020CCA238|nr:SGNH/GDSL hydrolase family protein [Lacihabitans sp. CCS-44]MCP9755803.1 lysophospholipase [Lacihabitans sp. CCS-44]
MENNRRAFIKKLGLGSFSAFGFSENEFLLDSKIKKEGLTVLFQGDSITDGNRTRNNDWNHVMGHGYQFIIASKLWFENPKSNLKFYNRGISGNRVTDLENRWQEDAITLKPDIISILIGVNDTMSVVNNQNPQTIETFETSYRNLLKKSKRELPNVKFVICEPFILENGWVNKNTEIWKIEIEKRQKVAKAIAQEFDAIFVPFQQLFIDACEKAPIDYWIWDGVHPMPAGHELMARQWLKVVGKYMHF